MISQQQTVKRVVQIRCPLCDVSFEPQETQTNICTQCLIQQEDITKDISRQESVEWCVYCRRYNRPPWILCERESKDLLSICLRRIRGLNTVQVVDAAFVFTEASNKILKVRLTVQKDVLKTSKLQQTLVVELKEEYTQCDDCRKAFTPHQWIAQIQLRQRVAHKKTFYMLEQLMIKHHMQEKIMRIENADDGLDLFFKSHQSAKQMLEFLQQVIPIRPKHSQELISYNERNYTAHIKHTYSVEIPKICKDNLVLIPHKLAQQLGGVGMFQLCYKITSLIHFIDPLTLRCSDLSVDKYFLFAPNIFVFDLRDIGSNFTIVDVEPVHNKNMNESFLSSVTNNFIDRIVKVEVMKDDSGTDYTTYSTKSHLGHILRTGQTVRGFDLTNWNNITNEFGHKPEIVLVQIVKEKKPNKKKLPRLNIERKEETNKGKKQVQKLIEKEENEFEEFAQEFEPDEHKVVVVPKPEKKDQDHTADQSEQGEEQKQQFD